jgi:hypothetical protein
MRLTLVRRAVPTRSVRVRQGAVAHKRESVRLKRVSHYSALMAYTVLALAGLVAPAFSLNNGLARTPVMGWNPYNAFGCGTTEAQYHTQTDALVSSGLSALGYKYMIMCVCAYAPYSVLFYSNVIL